MLRSRQSPTRRQVPQSVIVAPAEKLDDRTLLSAYFVSPDGDDSGSGASDAPFASIQHALDTADEAGDTINVLPGRYSEKVEFPHSGDSKDGPITLQASGEVILDGRGVDGDHMILIQDQHHVTVNGFEIVNNLNVEDGSGIRIQGTGHHIEIVNNEIHEMRGESAMGITVYGTEKKAIRYLKIEGNEIYDSEPAPSEALVVNGNVGNFTISSNQVHDVNNIGIDVIGGEKDINPDVTKVARNGIVADNVVYRARSNYGGGYGAGIYVDGAKRITIERNEVYESDLGIEIGAENKGIETYGVVVRNNIVHHNDKAGLVFGGYGENTGRVRNSRFHNNTFYKNDTQNEGLGQIWIQFAYKNKVHNNIFVAADNNVLMYSDEGTGNNTINSNVWYASAGADSAEFTWRGESYDSFADYRRGSGKDGASTFADPDFVNEPGNDFRLNRQSPAIDAGTSKRNLFAQTDFDRIFRPQGGNVDAGAFEFLDR